MRLTALHMAMRFRAERGETPAGMATQALRLRIAEETDISPLPAARLDLVKREAARLLSYSVADMPPTSDDIALLLDTLVFAMGETSRAAAWRHIGIKPRQGDDLIVRNRKSVDWPIWFTLRHYALGE